MAGYQKQILPSSWSPINQHSTMSAKEINPITYLLKTGGPTRNRTQVVLLSEQIL